MRISPGQFRGAWRRTISSLVLLAVLASVGALPAASPSVLAEAQAQAGGAVGTPYTGGPGVTESVDTIMGRQAAHDQQPTAAADAHETARAQYYRATGRVPAE